MSRRVLTRHGAEMSRTRMVPRSTWRLAQIADLHAAEPAASSASWARALGWTRGDAVIAAAAAMEAAACSCRGSSFAGEMVGVIQRDVICAHSRWTAAAVRPGGQLVTANKSPSSSGEGWFILFGASRLGMHGTPAGDGMVGEAQAAARHKSHRTQSSYVVLTCAAQRHTQQHGQSGIACAEPSRDVRYLPSTISTT